MALRLIGRDVTLLKVGTYDVLARFRRAEITIESDTTDTSAVKDLWRSSAVIRKGWSARVTTLLEADPEFLIAAKTASETSPLAFQCAVTYTTATGTVTKTFSGNAIPRRGSLSAEDILTQEMELEGIGECTIT